MRLKKIKLSGFKSFVDPITIPVSGNLIGIVGPNGCGKSNIIDAVRWVMGESSARHLRGDSMADVIFSGSTARKPVGKASVELIFDNSDGGAPGQYASYAEISIRREAGRDGQSDYFLNRTRCRRKDITDLFLGTGLGPNSYSILEQNAVTRIIESKPEELRSFFEEAAGVSRFKERRRETENRIKHTRENLARVEDVRKELDSQLQRLQRQVRVTQKYRELKQEERLLRAQLLGLRWRNLDGHLREHDVSLAARETALEGLIAELRSCEAEIEQLRVLQAEAGDRFGRIQAEHYAVGSEVDTLEQSIQHARDTRQQRLREKEQLDQSWEESSRHRHDDSARLEDLQKALEAVAPVLSEHEQERLHLAEVFASAEQAMVQWQTEWEQFGQIVSEPERARDIQGARIASLEQQIAQFVARQERLREEAGAIAREISANDVVQLRGEVTERDRVYENYERELEDLESRIRHLRAENESCTAVLEEVRGRIQTAEARLAGLTELQAAALGKHDQALNDWLEQHSLAAAPRLAGMLEVEPGWEPAFERVLGADLAAVCVSVLDRVAGDLAKLKGAELTVVETSPPLAGAAVAGRIPLLDKVRADTDVSGLLAGICVADTLEDALAMRAGLLAHESVVTRAGDWLGRNWMAVADRDGVRAGMLGREREIEVLEGSLGTLRASLDESKSVSAGLQSQLAGLEQQREQRRRDVTEYGRERAAAHSRLGHQEARMAQQQERQRQIGDEQGEIAQQKEQAAAALAEAQQHLQDAVRRGESLDTRRRDLIQQRDACRSRLEDTRTQVAAAGEAVHRLEIERQRMQTEFETIRQNIDRLDSQLGHLAGRRRSLEEMLSREEQPVEELAARLQLALGRRMEIDARLSEARQATVDLEAHARELQQTCSRKELVIGEARDALEGERRTREGIVARREALVEQLGETGTGVVIEDVVRDLPAEAGEDGWQQRLEEISRKIERLGPPNMAAEDEHREHSERKGYLDRQYEDLSQALTTLEDAIRKIDRETRTRFRETFDKVNSGFQELFPRLFGGGEAHLELTGEELLEGGVRVMARPPGKRNSTIHLLSGGEKALTAVSLLFALFELNPAPFCLLDEVDAPLDDANVVRYSQMLKALSGRTQLIYITHNKISMEIAELLVGVTMSEPGVSRLVAVDVEEAMEMVAK